MYYPIVLVLIGHILYVSVKAFVLGLKSEEVNGVSREVYFSVALTPIPIFIGIFLYFGFFEVPGISMGLTLSLLINYIMQIRTQISTDRLTGINNRRAAEKFFYRKINDINKNTSVIDLYLFMIDLNKFKMINDNYGHTEGDSALIYVAEVLKTTCIYVKNNSVIFRFGGDEFLMGANLEDDLKADEICSMIHTLLAQKSKEANLPYVISASIGYAKYTREMKNFHNFLTNVDKLMYENKLYSKL